MHILWEDVSWSRGRGFPLRLPVRYCFQMAAKPVGPETSIFAGSLGLQDKHSSNIQGHYLCTVKTGNSLFFTRFLKEDFFGFFQYFIQHCFFCRPSDPLCRRMLGSNPRLLRLRHWLSDALTTRIGIITLLGLIHNRLGLIHLHKFVMSMVRVITACTA